MHSQRLIKMINEQITNGILCTTDRDEQPNAAVIGSARMNNHETLSVALMENRTLANLRNCPKAVYLCSEPGTSPMMWRGARLYLLCKEIRTKGEEFEREISGVRERAGDDAAGRIVAVANFKISEVRRLIEI